MSAKSKVSGFLAAVIIAVVSFFAIFFFFPEYSDKFLGTSYKSNKEVQKSVSDAKEQIQDKANKVVSETIDSLLKK